MIGPSRTRESSGCRCSGISFATSHGAPPPRDPTDRGELEADLQRLDASLRKLEIEYTLYFGGQRPRPPLELRAAVERIVKRWERVSIGSATPRFRFSTLVQRYRTYATLWERGMRAREEGRPGPFQGLGNG